MSSQLKKQLKQLGLSKGFHGKRGAKASLIYDPKEAANLSSQDIYAACLEGYLELCRLDNRFEPFQSSLFAGVPKEREQRTKAEDENVQQSITAFCRLLTDHFLEPCAFKALEHLIRSYKVHEYSVDALMYCALPYHDTREFQQLLGVLELEETTWFWLKRVQEAGIALPRSALVTRCLKDMAFLRFIGEMAKSAASTEFHNQSAFSFYTVTVCEMMHAADKVTEEMLQCLIKYIFDGLLTDAEMSLDFRSSSYAIVVVLLENATLSNKLLSALVEALVGGLNEELLPQVLSIISFLYKTQEQYTSMSSQTVKALSRVGNLGTVLGGIIRQGLDGVPMLQVLMSHLLDTMHEKSRSMKALERILSDVPLSEALIGLIVRKVMDKAATEGDTEASPVRDAHQKLMRLLDLHFPSELDRVVNRQFRKQSSVEKKTSKSGKRKRGEPTMEQNVKQQKLMGYLQNCLAGTLHQPVSEGCDLMLSLAVDAPQAQTRKLALEQLTTLVSSSDVKPHTKQFANNAILRRLEDDDFNVVHAAMKCPFDTSHIDLELYYRTVQASFDRAALAVWKEISCEGDALEAAKQGARLLGVAIAKEHNYKCEEVYAYLIGYLLIPGARGQELSAYILHILTEIRHSWMGMVSDYLKKNRCNVRGMLSQLPNILGTTFGRTVETLIITSPRRTCHVLLIAMAKICASGTGEEIHNVSKAVVEMAQHIWNALDLASSNEQHSKMESDKGCPPAIMFSDTSTPTEEHLLFSADFCHIAAQITLTHLLHLSLRSLANGNKTCVPLETLHGVFVQLLRLGSKQVFETHLLYLLSIAEAGGVSRWQFLVQLIGLQADREDENVQAGALQALNKALKEASRSQSQEPKGEVLLLLLPYVLASVSSEANVVRENGCQVLDTLGQLLGNTHGPEEKKLKKTINAFLESPEMAVGNLKGDSTAALRLMRKYMSTDTGKELIQHLTSLIYPHLKVSSGKVCLFIVESMVTDEADGMTLVYLLPLLKSLLSFGAEHGVSDTSQIPTNISLEVGRKILELYTMANLKNLLDHNRKEFSSAINLLTATLKDTRDPMIAGDSQASFISDMKVLFCHQAANLFAIIEDNDIRAQVFDTILSLQAFGLDSDVKNAAKEVLTRISIRGRDLLPHLMPVNSNQMEEVSVLQLLPPLCLPALEMVQWKPDIKGDSEVLRAIEHLAGALMPAVKDPTVVAEEKIDYPIRLCLSAMMNLVTKAHAAGNVTDLKVSLIVEYLRYAPDGSLRNLAVELLGIVARCWPSQTLEHVLEVLQLMGTTGIFEDDEQSRQVATKALEATVPAWVRAGKGTKQLWKTAMSVLPTAHPLHRIPILKSILLPMPQVEGLASAVLVMLEEYLEKSSACSEGESSHWILKILQELSRTAPLSIRAQAFAQCLKGVINEFVSSNVEAMSNGELGLLVIKFISSEVKGFAYWNTEENLHSATAVALSTTCVSLLHGSLEVLSQLSNKLESKEYVVERKDKIQAISDSLLHLVECLKSVMNPPVYIQSIVKFVSSSSTGVMHHALRLYSNKMKEIEDSMVALSSDDAQDVQTMASAALEICDPVIELIKNPDSDQVMKQMGLAAIQSSVLVFGGQHSAKFVNVLDCIPDIVAEGSRGLKGSALATVAAVVKGLGLATVPYLPKVAPMVLSATESALTSLRKVNEMQLDSPQKSKADVDLGDKNPFGQNSEEVELIVLELVGGLMVIREIVNHLEDFINPYLSQILDIVLNPKVQNYQDMGCGSLGKSIAAEIAQCIPPRQLLKDLFSRFEQAQVEGKDSLVQLMELVGIIASKLNPKSATSYGDQIFMFLLKVLDIRQNGSFSIQATQAVEESCISAVEQLVMKLTEKQFKPMFMKLIEWSHVKMESVKGSYLGRSVTFFQLVGRLVQRLRSLLVTYIDFFLEDSIRILLAVETSQSGKKKMKQGEKKQEVSPWDRQNMYLLRLYMVRALHRFCISDMGGFLTSEKLTEVFPAVVHQFKIGEPSQADMQEMSFISLDGELESGITLSSTSEVDILGIATISCLVKIAVMGGSEDLWKLVNLNVLKAAKKGAKYNRILVVEFIRELVKSLKEDFLPLVPETLPKLAEFLEDHETVVSNRAREVIRSLEALSGENYDEYLK